MKKEPLNDKFDNTLARTLVKAIREGKFQLQGIDRAIFIAGQLSRQSKTVK